MELSDERVLEALLRDLEGRTKTARKAPAQTPVVTVRTTSVYEAPAKKSHSRRCRCGICPRCQENARWERIFQAKFADPHYYTRRSVPHVSSLGEK